MKTKTALTFAAVCIALSASASPAADLTGGKSKDAFIEGLLSKMSVTEQLGQLDMESGQLEYNVGASDLASTLTGKPAHLSEAAKQNAMTGNADPSPRDGAQLIDEVKAGRIGSFLNVVGVKTIKELQMIAVEQSTRKIPLLFGFDVIHGYRTVFPSTLGESTSWDPALAERTARAAAIEADAVGLHWTFGPDADLARDARWGRIMETFGEDPFLNAEMVKAKVRGYQTEKLGGNGAIAATLKHYVGYGAVQSGREYATVSVSPTDLFNFHMPPFIEGVAAGARTVMPSFTDVDSVPMSVNRALMVDVLRERMGFAGVTVSDWESIRETILHGVSNDQKDAARKGLRAQIDVDMYGRSYRALETVELTREDKSLVRAAAKRVLEMKWDLGLFKDPYRNLDLERESTLLLTGETRKLAREAVGKSTILLKNEAATLPLKKGARSVALVGLLADSAADMLGPWHGVGRASEVVTVREALSQPGFFKRFSYAKGSRAVEGAHLLEALGLHDDKIPTDRRSNKALIDEAVRQARAADVTIAVVGEISRMSGENASRADISIPEPQMQMLRALRKSAKKLVTVVIAGRPLLMKEAMDLSDAVLYAWHPGTEAGMGLRDVMFGAVIPSAKTTMSFPRSVGQLPLFYNQKSTGRPEVPGMAYKSTYLDVENEALIPFGFGMSYAKFEYGELALSKAEMKGAGKDYVTVTVPVKNVGAVDAEEIVQLYVHDQVASIARPMLELKAFKKLALKKGEEKSAEFRIDLDDLSFFNAKLERVAEPGAFQIMVGPDSIHLAKKTLVIK